MKHLSALVLGSLVLAATLALPKVGESSSVTIYNTKSSEGEVWVSVDLTRHRLNQDYIPLQVIVRNTAGRSITLDRSSFKLIGADHNVIPLTAFEEWRNNYQLAVADLTMLRFFGLPLGTLLDVSDLEPSNFFPAAAGEGVLFDHVGLAPFHWTTDLLYFKQPAGLSDGHTVVLEVAPKGWEAPIKVDIQL